MRADRVGELGLQHRELLVHVPPARDERALVAFDVGERPKPVVLQLEHPVWMIERRENAQQRHGAERRGHRLSVAVDSRGVEGTESLGKSLTRYTADMGDAPEREIVIEEEDSGAFSAYVRGLPVYAGADTREEADVAIRQVLAAYLAEHPDA